VGPTAKNYTCNSLSLAVGVGPVHFYAAYRKLVICQAKVP